MTARVVPIGSRTRISVAESSTINCDSACTITVVHELSLPPFQLSTEDGGLIAGAVLAVWAVGFVFRLAIRALFIDGSSSSSSSSSYESES